MACATAGTARQWHSTRYTSTYSQPIVNHIEDTVNSTSQTHLITHWQFSCHGRGVQVSGPRGNSSQYLGACICICMRTPIHIYIYIYVYIYIYIQHIIILYDTMLYYIICVCIHIYIYIYIYTHIYIYIYRYTHIHTYHTLGRTSTNSGSRFILALCRIELICE